MSAATSLLIAVLCGPCGFREKLKVLTMVNEMLYNADAVCLFQSSPGLCCMLETLQLTQETGLGAAADESIRMLATEIRKACSPAPSSPSSSSSSTASLSSGSSSLRSRLRSAPSAAKMRSVLEKKTSSMLQSAEKVAVQSLDAALTSAEKTVDSTSSTFQKAFTDLKEVHSYVWGEIYGQTSSKSTSRRPCKVKARPASGETLSWDDNYGWMVERNRQIPSIGVQNVQWERRIEVL